MENELVPEIHDILKLAREIKKDGQTLNPHSKPELVINDLKDNPTWQGVCKHHHGERFKTFPDKSDLFLLDVADNLASSTSRVLRFGRGERYEIDDSVFRLWKNSSSDIEKGRKLRSLELKEIIEFVAQNPSWDKYREKYNQKLIQQAEDAKLGNNIVSLYTHSKLTGQFYRILKNAGFSILDTELTDRETVSENYKDIVGKWKLTVFKCKVNFSQKPFRVRDLNVLKVREDIINEIQQKFQDNVLFKTSNEILLISNDGMLSDQIEQIIALYGFWLEKVSATSPITGLKPNPLRVIGNKTFNKYQNLVDQINPPICEICQLAPAEYTRIDEKSGVKEELCKYCRQIQEGGERLTKLAKWTYVEDIRTAWLKVSLDFDKLADTLRQLYIEYLKWLDIPDPERKAEIRFSVLFEFQFDYDNFLNQLKEEIVSKFDDENVEQILGDFFCVKIDKLSEIIKILRIYKEFIECYFPKFKETPESPIKLVISCSHVKFPFFEHWRYLKNPEDDVNVMLIGRGKMNIKLKQLGNLLDLKLANKTAIERLARMAETSEELAFMQIFSEEGIKNHPELQEALKKGFNLRDLLTYVKIKSD